MAIVTLKGTECSTSGSMPGNGVQIPDFTLTASDLSDKNKNSFSGKRLVLNIFPSVDTKTCSQSVRTFNTRAGSLGKDIMILCISKDLPFAQDRFCAAEGIKQVIMLSSFRNNDFGNDYGVLLKDGPLKGLFARAVIVTDNRGSVIYSELVDEISNEPDYDSALAVL